MITQRELKVNDRNSWARRVSGQSSGYLKTCRYCRETIYMHQDFDGRWRPYEAWSVGTVPEGEWVRHGCP